ncbi:MAG: ribonuclease J, partial [Alphaproteobacteria bacterium]
MNLYAYGHNNEWLVVDCGVAFGDLSTPGMDVLVPDVSALVEGGGKIVGMAITHAHEDHIGGIPHLIDDLDCPVYATPFGVSMIERKVDSYGGSTGDLIRVKPGSSVKIGGFDVEFVPVTHSIPEACALSITTPVGRMIHTGDWKIDPDPQLGMMFDSDRLAALGRDGVLGLVCDSTNALEEGHSGSEGEVYPELLEVVKNATGRVAVTCFATNVARVATVAKVAEATGRRLALIGRSLHRLYEVSKENGYLQSFPDVVPEDAVGRLPREEVLMLVTG